MCEVLISNECLNKYIFVRNDNSQCTDSVSNRRNKDLIEMQGIQK